MKDMFISTVSHELRTPLNGILGSISILEDTRLDEDQREFLDVIGKSSKSLLNLVNSILDLSKSEAGLLKLEIAKFNLRDVIEESLEIAASYLIQFHKDLELGHLIEEENDFVESVVGDEKRLLQILLNLLSNAIKFTRNGSVSILISQSKMEENGIMIHFCVVDSGIGILEEKKKDLFTPFVQIGAHSGGTGLGLSISKQLVKLMVLLRDWVF